MTRTLVAAAAVLSTSLTACSLDQRIRGPWTVTRMEQSGDVVSFPVEYDYNGGTTREGIRFIFGKDGQGSWLYYYDETESGGSWSDEEYKTAWEKTGRAQVQVNDVEAQYLSAACEILGREMECSGRFDGAPATMSLEAMD